MLIRKIQYSTNVDLRTWEPIQQLDSRPSHRLGISAQCPYQFISR